MDKKIAFALTAIILILLGGSAFAAGTLTIDGAPANWQNTDATATVKIDANECPADSNCKIKIFDSNPTTCPVVFEDYNLASPQTISANKWVCGAEKDNADQNSFSTPVEFKVDKAIPSTTDDYASKDNVWQNANQTITITPADTGGSGLAFTKWCVDTTNTCDANAGADYNSVVSITAEGTNYFRYASKDNAGNLQTVARTVKIDKTIAILSDFYSSTGSNWTNSQSPSFTITASDSGAGLGKMRFSCNNSDWTSEIAYSLSYGSFNFISGASGCNTTEGTKTIYAQVNDSAGTGWTASRSTTVNYDYTNPTTPGAPIISVGNGQVTASWGTVSDNGPSGLKEYKVYKNGSIYTTVSTSSNSATIAGLTNGTSYDFKVGAVDYAGNEAISPITSAAPQSSGTTSTVDTSTQDDTGNPSISWQAPAANSSVSGIVTLEVRAADSGKGINFVTFELPDKNYVTVSQISSGGMFNGTWQLQWFTWDLENGSEYTIKVMSKDNASPRNNSSSWVSRAFKVDNSQAAEEKQREETQNAIDAAEKARQNAEEYLASLSETGIGPGTSTLDKKASADALLKSAKTKLAQKNYDSAEQNAESALEKYESLSGITIGSYSEALEYLFSEDKLGIFLRAIGLSDPLVQECTQIMDQCSVDRELEIKEIKDGNNSSYKAVMTITIENKSSEDRELKILEVIPKEIAENASQIVSAEDFTVLEADPKIEFNLTVKAGETKKISYALKQDFTKTAADEFLASNPMDFFVAPPVLLNQGTDALGTLGAGENTAAFAVFSGIAENGLAIGIIIIVIIIAITAFLMARNSNSSEDYNRLSYGSGNMGFLDNFKKEKKTGSESKQGKWSFKGK